MPYAFDFFRTFAQNPRAFPPFICGSLLDLWKVGYHNSSFPMKYRENMYMDTDGCTKKEVIIAYDRL